MIKDAGYQRLLALQQEGQRKIQTSELKRCPECKRFINPNRTTEGNDLIVSQHGQFIKFCECE